jgi:hypothetical protein
LGTTPALAKSTTTDFEAVVVICAYGDSAREWLEETDKGTIWHVRHLVYQTPVYSKDVHVTGTATWCENADMNILTGDGRTWGTGVIKTQIGTWRISFKGGFKDGMRYSQGKGAGVDGLQAHKMYFRGRQGGQLPGGIENPCTSEGYLIGTLSGWIVDHRGKQTRMAWMRRAGKRCASLAAATNIRSIPPVVRDDGGGPV